MEKRKTQDATGEDAKPEGWRERLSSLFRRPSAKGDTGTQLPTKERPPPSLLLSDDELNLVKTSYMSRLHERYTAMHIFGLDARRKAMQESGQVLDFFSLYIPLNTTLEVPTDQEPSKTDARLAGLPKTRALSLLQVVGQERKVLVRGTIGSSSLPICSHGQSFCRHRPRIHGSHRRDDMSAGRIHQSSSRPLDL